jgi:uncharacterized protein YyaL (SSP411 family)
MDSITPPIREPAGRRSSLPSFVMNSFSYADSTTSLFKGASNAATPLRAMETTDARDRWAVLAAARPVDVGRPGNAADDRNKRTSVAASTAGEDARSASLRSTHRTIATQAAGSQQANEQSRWASLRSTYPAGLDPARESPVARAGTPRVAKTDGGEETRKRGDQLARATNSASSACSPGLHFSLSPRLAPERTARSRHTEWWRTVGGLVLALTGLIIAAIGCTLAEGDSDPAPLSEEQPSRHTNRLARESSPYLLAHSHNPVDWYPWGPEALEKARKEDKPIFLSIGYSACHWCHVMEKKVFSNPEIARYMNEHFVNIKVDREERPDIDDIYMLALQLYYDLAKSPQSGGWPLSMFLTPDARPIGGGTYFPPEDENGRIGFPSLMKKVVESWREHRDQMEANARILSDAVRSAARPRMNLSAIALDRTLIEPVVKSLAESYDDEYGGFGFNPKAPDRPKFPQPAKLALLQYEAKRHGDESAGRMLSLTLDRIAAGGIYDHVGGGFHRYSTDRFWRVPHFEKMLYDNAQLADIYAEAYRYTNQNHFKDVVEGTIEFVLRELKSPSGAFYSAIDADSEGVEGKYYIWTDAQLAEVLSPDEITVCNMLFGTGGAQNFEIGHVLELKRSVDEAAKKLKLPALEVQKLRTQIVKKLLAARQERRPPARDDKILAGWNGLMIRALARAYVTLQKPEYLQAAEKAATFVLGQMRDEKGRLYHSYAGKQARLDAYLDDYAYVNDGLLALHLATGDEKWASAARKLCDAQLQLFWDEQGKGCYFTSHQHETLLARTKNAYDSVLPSGNAVTVRNLLRLSSISKQIDYRHRARETLELFAPLIADAPGGLTSMGLALVEFLDTNEPATGDRSAARTRLGIAPDADIVLAGGKSEEPAGRGKKQKKLEPVTAQAYLSVDKLPAGGTAKVLVQLTIAEGWHIHANPAGDPDLDLATELESDSKVGLELKKVRYPVGKEVARDSGDPDDPPQILYMGKVSLIGEVEVPATAAGKKDEFVVRVAYQACNDNQCLPPAKLKLTIPVTIARQGEAVKPINESLFASPAKKK